MVNYGSRLNHFDGPEHRLSRGDGTYGNQNYDAEYDPMSSDNKKRKYCRHNPYQIHNLEE